MKRIYAYPYNEALLINLETGRSIKEALTYARELVKTPLYKKNNVVNLAKFLRCKVVKIKHYTFSEWALRNS